MSMPPGPDPNDPGAMNQLRSMDIGEMERFKGEPDLIVKEVKLKPEQREGLRATLSGLMASGVDQIDNKLLNQLLEPLATPLAVARRNGQAGTRLSLEAQRVLYAAKILAFDVWDHDGHHSSEIMTALVDMWSLREAGDIRKGRRRRWEMAKLLWVAIRHRDEGLKFTIEEIGKLPYDSHRRVAANPRLSQVLMEMGISAVNENPDHLNSDWFGKKGYHWWSIEDDSSIGDELETKVLKGFYQLLTESLGITDARDFSTLHCPFKSGTHWSDSLVLTYDGSVLEGGFDALGLNWRGSNLTRTIEAPEVTQEAGLHVLRIITPIPTRTDIIGPAPVF